LKDRRKKCKDIIGCWWFLDQFWTPIVRIMPLKTPFGLLLLLFRSQSHVTTFTHNYFLRCYTCTQLTITYTFVTTITYYTLTRLYWLTSQLSITVSNYHTLYIFTRRNSRRELTLRIHFLRLLLKNSLVGLLLTNSSRELTSTD
jgi:hypothetical protein